MQIDTLLEIEGFATAWTGSDPTGAPASWSQTVVQGLASTPPLQTVGVDPITGDFQHGGMVSALLDLSAQLLHRETTPRTALTADLSAAATSATVDDTTAFDATGTIWVDREAMTYTGKTATTFTGLTRGSLGTTAAAHTQTVGNENRKVWGYNPVLLGRKVLIWRWGDIATTQTFTGYIDAVTFDGGAYRIDLINQAARLEAETIATMSRARGSFLGAVKPLVAGKYEYVGLGKDDKWNALDVALEDDTVPFTAMPGGSEIFLKMGSEVIRAIVSTHPAWSDTAISLLTLSAGVGQGFVSATAPNVGDILEFTDGTSGDTERATVVFVQEVLGSGFDVYHSGNGTNPGAGGTVTTPFRQRLEVLSRGHLGTAPADHTIGAEVSAVVSLRGDSVDMALQLLISGSGSGGAYDTLGSDIGASISTNDIDVDSFDALRLYSLHRMYRFEEPATPKRIVTDLARITGGRVFVGADGQIRAARADALYPGSTSTASLTNTADLIAGTIPRWRIEQTKVYNAWSWTFAEGHTANFADDASLAIYDRKSLPPPDSAASFMSISLSTAAGVADGTLLRWSSPHPLMEMVVAIEETEMLEPGDIIAVTMPHIPDEQGGEELFGTELWECLEYAPQENETARIQMLRIPYQENVGIIAPSGSVTGFDIPGKWVIIGTESSTHYASATDRSAGLSDILGSGEPGTEDIDWFLDSDELTLWDASTLGNASATTATATVTAIDYTTRKITLSAIPAWIAIGDLVRLSNYSATKVGANSTERLDYFCAAADSTPQVGGTDDPYRWGM